MPALRRLSSARRLVLLAIATFALALGFQAQARAVTTPLPTEVTDHIDELLGQVEARGVPSGRGPAPCTGLCPALLE